MIKFEKLHTSVGTSSQTLRSCIPFIPGSRTSMEKLENINFNYKTEKPTP